MKIFLAIFLFLVSSWIHASTKVVVSVLPMKFLVEQIGGKQVEVSELIVSGHNPVGFELGMSHMMAVSQGDIYFRLGLPFERTLIPRLKNINPHLKVVDIKLPKRVEADPHLWTSPRACREMIRQIKDVLISLDKNLEPSIKTRATQLDLKFENLSRKIQRSLKPHKGKTFLVYHPAWGYFADEFGLKQMAIEKQEREPGPKEMIRIRREAENLGITAVFVQKEFSDRHAKRIAESMGVPVVEVDPLGENLLQLIQEFSKKLSEVLN